MTRPSVLWALSALGLAASWGWSQGRLPPAPTFQAWTAYFRGPEGIRTWERCHGALEEVSVFALQFDGQGKVTPASPWVPEALNTLRSSPNRPGRLWLTVVNDLHDGNQNILKDSAIVHEKIATPQARAQHVEDLLTWAEGVDGLDIDYEGLKKEDGEAFSLFIEELARRLHTNRKLLSVTVEPKTTLLPGNGARAIDWKRIGTAADQVRVMAYFLHFPKGSPGPMASLSWLSDLVKFARERIPEEKLTVILTVNGLDWPSAGKGRGIRFPEATALALERGIKPKRDSASGSPHFRYSEGSDGHEVWYEDSLSLQAKIRRLHEEGVQRIGFWQLGSGDPDFWEWLNAKGMKPSKEPSSSSKSDPLTRSSHRSS